MFQYSLPTGKPARQSYDKKVKKRKDIATELGRLPWTTVMAYVKRENASAIHSNYQQPKTTRYGNC